MKHDEKMMGEGHHMHMHEGPMHGPKHMHWQSSWKSPVSLGIFFAGSMFGLFMLMYAISLAGAAIQAMHPAASQGMSQQELQQMMQQSSSGAPSSATQ